METQINESLNDQLFLKKGNQGSRRDASTIRAQVTEKENQLMLMQNDIAKAQLDALNINDRIETLNQTLSELNRQYQGMIKQIETHELDSKKASDEITKKQAEIELLNKRLDALTNRLVTFSSFVVTSSTHTLNRKSQVDRLNQSSRTFHAKFTQKNAKRRRSNRCGSVRRMNWSFWSRKRVTWAMKSSNYKWNWLF